MGCLCCFRLRYESLGCDEGDDLEGADDEDDVSKGVRGLLSSLRTCDGELLCASGLGLEEVAGAELSEVEAPLARSGEASSGFAMRRPPSEPDKSRSPFMIELIHAKQQGLSACRFFFCLLEDLADSAPKWVGQEDSWK
jgi:hypothetical protein